MRWYPWLRPAFEQLLSQYQAGRGHHALLLHALPGMGAEALSYALIRWLMCLNPQGNKSCGQCKSCQLMQAGTHPDYIELSAEKGRQSIGIDPVRGLSETLASHARQGGARTIWIADANQLTEAAANALLKTLEEPPANSWFFLGTHEPGRLLPTLRSRCLYWHLAPPDSLYALQWLARECKTDETALRTALRLANGAPAAALALLEDSRWSQRRALIDALAVAIAQSAPLTLQKLLNDERAVERLDWWSTLLLDALKQHYPGGASAAVNLDALALTAEITRRFSPLALHNMLTLIQTSRQQLTSVSGINRELVISALLLRCERAISPHAAVQLPHL